MTEVALKPSFADGAARERPIDPAQRIPFLHKIYYGVGQFGEGLQGGTVQLLLFFYTQVIGLDAAIVGTGMLLAGIFDGVIDAFVGSWSDNTRHKWGRRHPYLYFSSIPAGISMILLFIPPAGLSTFGLFGWLFFWSLVLRTALTFYLIPHWALGVELSEDPRERVSIVASRIFFSFAGSGGLFVISLLFFRDGTTGSSLLQAGPYVDLAICIGIVAIVAKIGSGLGTHRYIPRLPQPAPGAQALGFRALWTEVRELFSNRPFRIFFIAALMVALGLAVSVLDIYMGTYFWKLPTHLTLILPGISTLAFAAGTFIWARLSRQYGVKRCYIAGVVGGGIVVAALPLAKISGLFVDADSALYFPTIVAVSILGKMLFSSAGVMAGTTLALVADDYEAQSGKSMSGIIAGFLMLIAKCGQAMAQMLAGFVISFIGLKARAAPDSVPVEVTDKLGMIYGLVALASALAFYLVFRSFPLGHKHSDI